MRMAIGVSYEGTSFHGWQAQQNLDTVQGRVEAALSKVADSPVEVVCAGRTDAGVHAIEQVAHFDCDKVRSLKTWVMGTNTHLPHEVRILWAREVPEDFHARYSALARRYLYYIHNAPIHSSLFFDRCVQYPWPLNLELMQQATRYLIGEHDFSAFRGIDCQAKTTSRRIFHLEVQQHQSMIIVDVKANAFLHHMVRNIVGVLLAIGAEKKPPTWAQEVLLSRSRAQAGVTAKAHGLYLTSVEYPAHYQIKATQGNEFFFIKQL
jgi:tRNA pseudouridine38-40 synthase